MDYCNHCGSELIENARFCSHCGTQTSFRNKLTGIRKRLQHKAQNTIDNLKQTLDEQLSQYLHQLNNDQEVKIGGVTIPEKRREGVRNAIQGFQNKYLEGEPVQSAEYENWINDLPKRLDEHNCVVCFAKWDAENKDDIVVCPRCQSGGHRDHLKNWIKSQHYCPLCRSEVSFSEYIKIV